MEQVGHCAKLCELLGGIVATAYAIISQIFNQNSKTKTISVFLYHKTMVVHFWLKINK